jgi:hypothetical protein
MISRVRNVHLSAFMNDYEDYDYFVSIDSDLEIVNKFSSNNIFTKLVEHDVKFCGGLYALKRDGERICSSVPMDRNRQPEFNSGLKPMLWLSTGCWCLRRDAVQQMIDAYPDLTYDGDDNMANKKIYGLYIPMLKTLHLNDKDVKKYLSEDWSFCERWKNLGGQIFADTSIVLRHYGEKSFSLWDIEILRKKRGQEEVQQSSEQIDSTIPQPLPEPGFDLGDQ